MSTIHRIFDGLILIAGENATQKLLIAILSVNIKYNNQFYSALIGCVYLYKYPVQFDYNQPFVCGDPRLSRIYKVSTVSNAFIIGYQQVAVYFIVQ